MSRSSSSRPAGRRSSTILHDMLRRSSRRRRKTPNRARTEKRTERGCRAWPGSLFSCQITRRIGQRRIGWLLLPGRGFWGPPALLLPLDPPPVLLAPAAPPMPVVPPVDALPAAPVPALVPPVPAPAPAPAPPAPPPACAWTKPIDAPASNAHIVSEKIVFRIGQLRLPLCRSTEAACGRS